MIEVPAEVYMHNMKGVQSGGLIYRKCSHRPWYKWWGKPHYRTIFRLRRDEKVFTKPKDVQQLIGEQPTTLIFPIEKSSHNNGLLMDTAEEQLCSTASMRRVQIIDVPDHIEDRHAESVFTKSSIKTERTNDNLHDNDYCSGRSKKQITTQFRVFSVEKYSHQNRESYFSVDYHSAASSLSDNDQPSIATASETSPYFSVSSENDTPLDVWLPPGDVRH